MLGKLVKKLNDAITISKILYHENELQSHYQEIVDRIKNRGEKKIRLGVYIVYDSSYGFDSVFRKMMLPDSNWDPRVVIIPDVFRGIQFSKKTYLKTREYMISLYGEDYIIDGWDLNEKYIDNTDKFDVIYFCNPYDVLVNPYHSIKYASGKSVLPFYITYGYEVSSYYTINRLRGEEINLLWRCYTDTNFSYSDYKRFEIRKARNVKQIGYLKMDGLYDCLNKQKINNKKTILITPHHTVLDNNLPLSNFVKYSKLFLRLPKMFEDIDFIFRPHPLMFVNLINNGIWSREEVDEYLNELVNNGIKYSVSGDYFDLFSEADAIINDSGSFTVEWLFTGKPGCFMRNPKLADRHLTTLMKKSISEYVPAYSEEDIISFIEGVNDGSYISKTEMKDWVRKDIAVNYPNVTDALLHDLESFFI